MTVKDFILKIQAYYGLEYRPGQGEMVVSYLDNYTKNAHHSLMALFGEVLKGVSSTYKSLPDIALFEEAQDRLEKDRRDRQQMDEPAYRRYRLLLEESTEGILSREEISARLADLKDGLGEKLEKIIGS